MVYLRSEEHVERWLRATGHPPGATFSAATLHGLAEGWWGSRLQPDWRPRPVPESQAILERAGLTGAFWQLAPSP
jgi:hypothetical protein